VAVAKIKEPTIIRSYPHWVSPPDHGQSVDSIEWGVMEVLSDKTLRFVRTNPDPIELEELLKELRKLDL
tara:strand:+ start:191 stop:397 length:207 start_codon:yes stop_codon:yes gene_type:complete